jgi:microcystin-dependent protein
MPRNSSGAYSLPAGNPVLANTLIETSWANPTMSDIAAALTDSLDRYGRGGMLGEFKVADGTVTAPGLAFTAQTNTGMYRVATNQIGFAAGGISVVRYSNTLLELLKPTTVAGNLDVTGAVSATEPVKLSSGTAAAPAMTFTGDPDTGFYSPGVGLLALVIDGVERMRWDAAGNVSNTVPIGTLLDFAGGAVPLGYLMCDGALVSRTTYANLFAVIGTAWGAGDGINTFGLPDLRRRVTIGTGGTATSGPGIVLGNVGGAEYTVLAIGHLPSHAHGITNTSHQHGVGVSGTTSAVSNDHAHYFATSAVGDHQHIAGVPGDNGSFYGLVQPGGLQAGKGGTVNYNTSYWTSGAGGHSHDGWTGGISANHTHTFSGSFATDWRDVGMTGTHAVGSGTPFENMQPSAVVNKIIKF